MKRPLTCLLLGLAAIGCGWSNLGVAEPIHQQPKRARLPSALPTTGGGGAMQMKMTNGAVVSGSSSAANHLRWVEFQEIIFAGGRQQAGERNNSARSFDEVTITRQVDIASPKIRQLALSRHALQEVLIDLFDTRFPGRSIRRVRMEKVVVVSVQPVERAPAGNVQLEKVVLRGRKLKLATGQGEWTDAPEQRF